MNVGRLIAFEGVDGAGKSTQLRRLGGSLREGGRAVVETREPTDGPWGRRIREMARSGARVPPEEELRWFVEDRREHVARVLRPSLDAGAIVLTDRYFLSTVAYQGARGLDPARLLADAEAGFPLPDLALVLDVDPAAGLARVAARGGVAEPAFEDGAFLERVVEVFRGLDRPYVQHVDGSLAPDAVATSVREIVRDRLRI